MHKSHQTRLTGLNNQLNDQHVNQINVLKEEYQERIDGLEETLKKLQEPNLEAQKIQEEQKQELLSKIEELESLALEHQTGYEQDISELKSKSAAEIEQLVATHQQKMDEIANSLKVRRGDFSCISHVFILMVLM